MLLLLLSLCFSVIGGLCLVVSLQEREHRPKKSRSLLIQNRSFSLASLVLLILFPPQDLSSATSTFDD